LTDSLRHDGREERIKVQEPKKLDEGGDSHCPSGGRQAGEMKNRFFMTILAALLLIAGVIYAFAAR
jgi:hypothetical protein